MDHASKALSSILESGEYARIPDVPLFDEHSEFDADGNLIRSFGEKRLHAICEHNNKRAHETGNLATFGPGHTIKDGPESMQPPVWAFAHNWTVKPFGKSGKPTIHADMYVKPSVEDEAGNKLNGIDAVRSMPHRSIELWTIDPDGKRIPGYVDHVALLRQTPKRDLGFLAFQKGEKVTIPASRTLYASPGKARNLQAAERGGKLFYAMEQPMDPTMPADAMAPDQAFIDKLKQALIALSPQFAAMLQPPPAPPAPATAPGLDAPGGDAPLPGSLDAPGGDAPMPPAPEKKDEPIPYAKNPRSAENRLAYLEKQNRELAESLKALKAEKDKEREDFSKADAESIVDQLERDGYVLDREREVLEFAKIDPGAKRKERADYLRRVHRTGHGSDIPPAGMIDIDSPNVATVSIDENKQALRFMKANGCTYDEAVEKFRKAR